METAISIMVIGFVVLVIVYVEMLMHRKPITGKEISDYQKRLNEMDANAKTAYGLDWKHDALTELTGERKQAKCFTLIFSGIFLAFVLILLAFITTLSPSNIGIICGNGIALICYGLIKMSESKKLAIAVLSFVFILGTLMMFVFDKLMTMSPYAYFYLCGLILVIGIFSFVPKLKKV
ncbi:hypothetical protein JXK06_02720 [Patescibacteria group bacterium]|nr:hypothetical protein [Patescibacteria group bacterium]